MIETRCTRCGHPQSWHRHDDANPEPPPTAPFRCLGYDCDAPGYVTGTPESRCGCPDFVVPPTEVEIPRCPHCKTVLIQEFTEHPEVKAAGLFDVVTMEPTGAYHCFKCGYRQPAPAVGGDAA